MFNIQIDNINIKKEYMNDTIGIILCRENNELVLKYSSDYRIYVSTYKLLIL